MSKPRVLVITPVSHIDGFKSALNNVFDVTFSEDINRDGLLRLSATYEAIFCNPNKQNFIIDSRCMEAIHAKVICTASTGLNHISQDVKDKYHIISLTTDYEHIKKISSTAELAITLSFALVRNLLPSTSHVAEGGWDYTQFVGRQFDKLKFGTLGLGRLGNIYLDRISSFTDHLYYYDPYVNSFDERFQSLDSINSLFSVCDVVSINIHATKDNHHLVSRSVIDSVSVGSPFFLVNTSRGEVVDEAYLASRLLSDKSFRYAADVLEHEFSTIRDSPLYPLIMNKHPSLVVTPHIGGMTTDAQQLAYFRVLSKLVSFFQSNP